MTAHELARKLLEGNDYEVVYLDSRQGQMQVDCVQETHYEGNFSDIEVVLLS